VLREFRKCQEGNMAAQMSKTDPKDRLIAALFAQLRAERETREALTWAIRSGVTSPEVLEALAGDPVPVATAEDVAALERLLALDDAGRKH
jgi:hypothetical protein